MIFRRIFAAVALLCVLVAPAYAQKTKAQLNNEITTTFPDNTIGAITPAGVRSYEADVVNSIMPTAPVASGNLACFNGATGLLQDCGKSPATFLAVANNLSDLSSASAARTNLGVTATGADTTYAFRANNLNDLASATTARTNLGVTATGADTTYAYRANNLSDLASAATARSNLGVTATGADTTYAFRANNLSDLASIATARGNLIPANSLALSQIIAGTSDTMLGYFAGTSVSAASIPNCSNALAYSTSTHSLTCNTLAGTGTVTTAGTGLSLSGGGSTLNLALTNATLQGAPGAPTGTSSATGVMMGLGATCKMTPVYSTRVLLEFRGMVANAAGGIQVTHSVRYGTGTAPTNGAALAGSTLNQIATAVYTAGVGTSFDNGGLISGLTPGTPYWFDLGVASSSGTSSVNSLSCTAVEF